jgi:hypothetical protein
VAPAPVVHGHLDHHTGLAAGNAAHDHGAPASEHPAHKRDACQTVCCFIPSYMPPHGPAASTVDFSCLVRYRDAAQLGRGRTDAPDPGIPKPAV